MVSLEGFQGKLLLGLDALLSELDNLTREDGLGRGCAVDTVGLDRNHDTTADLEELMCVQTDDTSLIGLRNIGEDAVDHADEHAVLERVTGVFDDGDDVRAVGGHVDKIATGPVGELDGEDGSGGTDDIRNVRDGGTGGGTEVEDLAAGLHVDVVHASEDTGCQLGAERVPDAVFGLCGGGSVAVGAGCGTGDGGGGFDGDALLAVDGLAGSQVLGDEEILLATGNEDTGVSVRLDNDLLASLMDDVLEWNSSRML